MTRSSATMRPVLTRSDHTGRCHIAAAASSSPTQNRAALGIRTAVSTGSHHPRIATCGLNPDNRGGTQLGTIKPVRTGRRYRASSAAWTYRW